MTFYYRVPISPCSLLASKFFTCIHLPGETSLKYRKIGEGEREWFPIAS